jgi:hypothetical protein
MVLGLEGLKEAVGGLCLGTSLVSILAERRGPGQFHWTVRPFEELNV